MTDIEEWMSKQAELGVVTVQIKSETLAWAKLCIDSGGYVSVNTEKVFEAGEAVLKVVAADRWKGTGDVLAMMPDGQRTVELNVPKDARFVEGSWRKVYKPGRFHGGGTGSAMGAIAKGIRSGRAFRGRG